MAKQTDKAKTPREPAVQREAKARVAAAPDGRSAQFDSFQAGMTLFHERKFGGARTLFETAMTGPDRAIGHKASLQMRMCDQRLSSPTLVLKTLDDHYNYAITLINARSLTTAQQHLKAALEIEPTADHVLYALALCCGLSGDLDGAYENLKRAIELQPRNRIAARQDTDFAGIANQPPLDRLLYPEKRH
jgi:tetratricopeptide (TPR) repeat protein